MSKKDASKKQIQITDLVTQLPKVVKDLPKILNALYYNYSITPETNISIGEVFLKTVRKFPNSTCIYYLDKSWTYDEFNNWVNRLANQFLKLGFKKGDVAAVLIENRPEILAISMALAKIGGVAALINTAQKHKPLIHSLHLAKPKLVLIGAELIENYIEVKKEVDFTNEIVYIIPNENIPFTKVKGIKEFDIKSASFSMREPIVHYKIQSRDANLYIYTSGTTGLPKASVISHGRWIKGYSAFGLTSLRLNEKDILYVPLPFFHATAMIVCWTSVIAGGAAIVIKNKFSITDFWKDISFYKATGFGYVGEMCKYLLNTPVHTLEKDNSLTKMIGNGLRPDIWNDFKSRFDVEQIAEFYASSEGNIAFFNVFNVDGTMGFSITSYAIVEYDIINDCVVRDKNGFMKKVPANGTGLLLGEINKRYPFDGYTENSKTEKSIVRNVFQKGDTWFNTGDLVRDMGFFHTQFVDRLGDTFRWKGENVSTVEVEGIINQYSGIAESIVYGVEIPETNGRAGMVKIIVDASTSKINLKDFYQYLSAELPSYAVPLFIRIADAAETTSTFKHKKHTLKEEAYDIHKVDENVFALIDKKYIRITKKIFQEINNGKYRF
jgi:citronellyl-CoA synthetase